MSYATKQYGIYPSLPVGAAATPGNAEDWRLNSCFHFDKEIQNDVTKYSKNLHKLKIRLKNLRLTSAVLTGSATALSIGGTALSATVFGVIVGGPIVGVGTLIGGFSLITLNMEKNIFKEIVKNEKLLTLINSKLSSLREKINKSLKDNKISEEEYKYIQDEFSQYKLMEEDTLSSKSSEKNMSRREMVQKMEEMIIKSTLK